MLLHIIRHPRAKPEDTTVDDQQRQVTKRGAKKFIRVLKRYDRASEMSPDIIFCGPETRNMQSAAIMRDYFGLDPNDVVVSNNLSPDGDPKKLLVEIQTWAKAQDDADSCEVVTLGSNPALVGFFQLVHGLGTKVGMSGDVKMKKGSVAKLKVYGITENAQSSQLRSYLPPGLAGK
ncbi:MAG: hypothetical protein NVS9B2_23390 [Steroidobacteraceae bacterium]